MGNEIIAQMKVNEDLNQIGFKRKDNSSLVSAFKSYNPSYGGSTALRDAIAFGSVKILAALKLLSDANMTEDYKFIHIVLTDGEDNSSSFEREQLDKILEKLQKIVRTIVIGVDMPNNCKEIISKHVEYHDVKSTDIEGLFHRIQLSLGLKQQTALIGMLNDDGDIGAAIIQKNKLALSIRKCKYMIIFTMDGSGSMSDEVGLGSQKQSKWLKSINAVEGFINTLQDGDRVNGNIFDSKTWCVS